MDYTVNGREQGRTSNQHSYAAPHGAYRCKGNDRWCAIGVFGDKEWVVFRQVIGESRWTADPKFATLTTRKKNEDKLDRLLEEWSIRYTPEQVMGMMRVKGIVAGIVQNARDTFGDAQLKHRNHYQLLEHVVMGKHVYQSPACKLSKTSGRPKRSAPVLGQHNEYVYKEILGLSEEEYVELLLDGVFD